MTVDGRRRGIGLGPFPTVSLAEARRRALANRLAVANGHDPLADKNRAFPVIGKMRVDRIRPEDVLRVLKPVWTVHPDVTDEAIDGALPPMPAVRTHRKLLFLQHIGIGENTR